MEIECLLALQITAQSMINELADATTIIDHYDTVGTLLLLAAVLPHSSRMQVLETIVHLVISKFPCFDKPLFPCQIIHGEPSMYMSVLNRVVDHLDRKGFLDDTKISQTRPVIPRYACGMTVNEIYQNHINIWSLPRFLWVNGETFHKLAMTWLQEGGIGRLGIYITTGQIYTIIFMQNAGIK